MKYIFHSNLSVEECRNRLLKNIDTSFLSGFSFKKGDYVYGTIKKDKFSLTKRIWVRDSFNPVLLGKLVTDQDGGTKAICNFSIYPTIGLITLIVCMIIAMVINQGFYTLSNLIIENVTIKSGLAFMFFIVATVLSALFFHKLSTRGNKEYLLNLVKQSLEVKN